LQSEQLHTQFYLSTSNGRAAGLMLQQLPPQIAQGADERAAQWEHATVIAETVTGDELLALEATEILHRLYHDQSLRVFTPQPVVYQCRCTRERSLDALGLLPLEELEQSFTEEGVISMTCDMCGEVYSFERQDIPALAEGRVLH
jgi:molecular chaperone Hsp33